MYPADPVTPRSRNDGSDEARVATRLVGATSVLGTITSVMLALIGVGLLTHVLLTIHYEGPGNAAPTTPQAAAQTTAAPALAADSSRRPARQRPRPVTTFMFAGARLEVSGVAWFLLALAIVLTPIGASTDVRTRFRGYLFYLSLPALIAIFSIAYSLQWNFLALGWRQFAATACALGIFAVAALSQHASARLMLRHLWSDLRLFTASRFVWMAAFAFMALIAFRPTPTAAAAGTPGIPTGAAFEAWWAAQPRVDAIPVAADGAAVVVVKFNDYQCPPCKKAHINYEPVIDKLNRESPGAIKLVTLDYPLNTACNRYVNADLHDVACQAAVAVRLARANHRGPAMEQWFWDHQTGLTPDAAVKAARDIGGVTDFSERFSTIVEQVRADVEVGHRLGVEGTPTHFINGVKLTPVATADFETILRYELAKAQAKAGRVAEGRTP
jgi:hypothetical protein